MKTKFEERIITTSDISEMKNMYLAKRLLRTWNEDFVDEDTGDVVSIERNELIFERGTHLNNDAISKINFHLQSGDIKEVEISNQQRECELVKNHASVWVVTFELNSKKKNIYLYANSIETARDIAIDFVEQKYSGVFKFKGIRELDYSNLISSNSSEETKKEEHYYKVEVEVNYEDEGLITQNFILNATDAEKAKVYIINFLTKLRQDSDQTGTFQVTILSAKTISCNDVVSHTFSKTYFENQSN